MLSKSERMELRRLHNELAELYRGGSVDSRAIDHYWQRIEYLEAMDDSHVE